MEAKAIDFGPENCGGLISRGTLDGLGESTKNVSQKFVKLDGLGAALGLLVDSDSFLLAEAERGLFFARFFADNKIDGTNVGFVNFIDGGFFGQATQNGVQETGGVFTPLSRMGSEQAKGIAILSQNDSGMGGVGELDLGTRGRGIFQTQTAEQIADKILGVSGALVVFFAKTLQVNDRLNVQFSRQGGGTTA